MFWSEFLQQAWSRAAWSASSWPSAMRMRLKGGDPRRSWAAAWQRCTSTSSATALGTPARRGLGRSPRLIRLLFNAEEPQPGPRPALRGGRRTSTGAWAKERWMVAPRRSGAETSWPSTCSRSSRPPSCALDEPTRALQTREIGRRTDVFVGIFPYTTIALIRLAGMLCIEQNDSVVSRPVGYLSAESISVPAPTR